MKKIFIAVIICFTFLLVSCSKGGTVKYELGRKELTYEHKLKYENDTNREDDWILLCTDGSVYKYRNSSNNPNSGDATQMENTRWFKFDDYLIIKESVRCQIFIIRGDKYEYLGYLQKTNIFDDFVED